MAEFLILRHDHPYTSKPAEWTQQKWDARQLAGDVVDVQANGTFRIEYLGEGRAGWDRNTFALIRIPSVSVSQGKNYATPYVSGNDLIRKFRYSINIAGISWNINTVTVNGTEYQEYYKDFNNVVQASITDKAT